jgi:hypothetical protein
MGVHSASNGIGEGVLTFASYPASTNRGSKVIRLLLPETLAELDQLIVYLPSLRALPFAFHVIYYGTPASCCQNSPTSPTLTCSISTMPTAHTSINHVLIANA